MKKKTNDQEPRRLWPRVLAFVLALVVAIGGITLGVLQIGHKEPGYHKVDANLSEEAKNYAQDISFQVYCEGSSDEIKHRLNAIKTTYSSTLLRVYMLLDAEVEYPGVTNLATLNAHIGEDLTLSEELFRVLTDAESKTREQKGYNLFNGAFSRAWQDIRYLSAPEEYDPLRNENERERLRLLCEAGGDLSNFALRVVDPEKRIVRFEVSENYLALLRELEQQGPILDLGLLHDAYELQLVGEAMEEAGFGDGYLVMNSGVTMLLSGNPSGELSLFGLRDGEVAPAAAAPAQSGSAGSLMRCFAEREGEAGYYVLDGQLRHPWLPASGAYYGLLQAALVTAKDPVTAVYRNICLQEAATQEALREIACADGASVAYILNDGDPTVYADEALFTAREDYGWHLIPLH